MKAVIFTEFGPPSVLRLEEVATPEPGPGEVVIKVHAVSVNRTLDVAVRAGQYARKPPLPHVLGVDPVGVISAVGSGVVNRKIGQRVAARPVVGLSPRGGHLLLGVNVWGGYAEYVRLPAGATHPIPDNIDFPTAAVIARHAPLAFTQLRERAKVQKDEWVLVMGAAGGLGSAAVQAAKYLGARVIGAAGSDARVAAAVELGADAGVNYRTQDLTAEVMRITQGLGTNIVLENLGDPDLFPKAFATLALRGRLITAGGHAGGLVTLDVKHLYINQITIIGAPGDLAADLDLALRVAGEGKLKVMVDQIMPLSQAARAHEIVESRAGIGKILLDPTRLD